MHWRGNIRLLAGLLLTIWTTLGYGAERVALVIGNAAYRDPPLTNPVNDARAMASRLAKLGFRVTKLENAARDDMEDAIIRLEESLGPDATGLFYYAGFSITPAMAYRFAAGVT